MNAATIYFGGAGNTGSRPNANGQILLCHFYGSGEFRKFGLSSLERGRIKLVDRLPPRWECGAAAERR